MLLLDVVDQAMFSTELTSSSISFFPKQQFKKNPQKKKTVTSPFSETQFRAQHTGTSALASKKGLLFFFLDLVSIFLIFKFPVVMLKKMKKVSVIW